MDRLATTGLEKVEQRSVETAKDLKRLEQECGEESDTYVCQRLEHNLLTLNVYRKKRS